MEPQTKHQGTEQAFHSVHKGPMEGVIIVDGRPRMERLDMSGISFESILAFQRFNEWLSAEKSRNHKKDGN